VPDTLEKFRLLAKATSDAIYDYDLLNNRLEWNENLSLWGYSPDDVQPGIEWWADRIHAEDREATLTSLDLALRGDSGHFEVTYRFRCGDGRYRYVSDRGYVLKDQAGNPTRLVGAMQDVHFFEQLFENNPQPLYVFQLDSLRFLAVNATACRLYGYTRDEFLQMNLTAIRPPEDVARLRAVVENPDPEQEGRSLWRHHTKAGKLLHVEVRTQEITYSGQAARLCLITDVSRRRMVEEQLRETQKLQAIGQLAGGLAHDFNNLLTIIQGYTKKLQDRRLSSDPDLEAIDLAASRAASLTQQLLTFARQEKSTPTSLVWSDLIAASELLLSKLLPPRITLQFATHTGPARVQANFHQIEQILLNLVTNARDAIPGKGHIQVTSAVIDMAADHPDALPSRPTGPYLQLTVADTGLGMDDTILTHIFEPFFTTKPEGTGLGLATVYGITLDCKGWVRVESQPGQGTEFRLYLPCTQPITASSYAALVVEDEPDLRRLIADSLRSKNLTVFEASGGGEALAILAANPIHVMVTDLVMPEREGLELIQAATARFPQVPILAISGAFDGHFLPLAKAFGAKLTLPKPIDMDELTRQVLLLLH
jgi:two-component system, cell cycle sensor histidine kinase and response regulator CckA